VVVDPDTELQFVHHLPVELMWGVGTATRARLSELRYLRLGGGERAEQLVVVGLVSVDPVGVGDEDRVHLDRTDPLGAVDRAGRLDLRVGAGGDLTVRSRRSDRGYCRRCQERFAHRASDARCRAPYPPPFRGSGLCLRSPSRASRSAFSDPTH
jgi:hypothetical protein